MSAQKPPTGHQHRSRRVFNENENKEKQTKNSDAFVLQRNAALIQRKVAQIRVDNTVAKKPKQVLHELLFTIKDEAERGISSRDKNARKLKRQAPLPPFKGSFLGATNSSPDLASGAPPSPKEVTRRTKLRKSLSLSGSRMLFHNFLNTIRLPSKRRSRSQDSIFNLGYLDQDQQLVRNAAVNAQQRRGTISGSLEKQSPHARSLSAEPRSQNPAPSREPAGLDRDSPTTGRRPGRLFLGSPKTAKKRYRERSPLVKTPIFITEQSIADAVDGGRPRNKQISDKARNEIKLFEALIADHLQYNLPSTSL